MEKSFSLSLSLSRFAILNLKCLLKSQVVLKNLSANAGDLKDAGSISGSGRSLEQEMATHSSILA